MAHSRLLRSLQALASQAAATGGGPALGRRAVLAGALAAGFAPRVARASATRVIVIGGGIAGLNAMRLLLDAGIDCTLYEAGTRLGGRMHSDTTTWQNGQVSEHCGELIDTGHSAIRWLAGHYKLKLADLHAAEPAGSTDTFYFGGSYYPQAQAQEDFAPVWTALQTDLTAAGYPTTYSRHTKAGVALDKMSVAAWIDSRVPGGHGSPLGQLLDVAYDIEFGAPSTDQSALNLVYLLGYQTDPTHFSMFGQSDERFHIIGGNERLPQAIAADIEARKPGTIRLGTALTAVARNADGSYTVELSGPGPGFDMADRLILALPFSVLRTLDLTAAGFSAAKLNAIRTLGYGTNAKLNVQFASRLWNQPGPWGASSTGESYADTGYQNTWDVTRAQSGATGILVDYLGSAGAYLPPGVAPADAQTAANAFLAQIEPVFPGLTAQWNGLATLDQPWRQPLQLGSYSYWRVGQYTTVAGLEKQPAGNCHFAGEHCSIDFQGYMEGGAREGARAAREVIAALA